MITIIQQGEFTTIQDGGRWGFRAYGMPLSGAMDQYAYQIANFLAGNKPNAAVVEMTGTGAAFKFDEEVLVAVSGADMNGDLNGVPIPNWTSFFVPRRGELRFRTASKGCRTYLAVHGGIDVPLILGSRSTYTRAKVGGYEGRALRQGDVLYIGSEAETAANPQKIPAAIIPRYDASLTLRVMLGPQDSMFTNEMIHTFLTSTYTVSDQVSRTGYQLNGPKILTGGTADIVSDAVGLGAVQVLSSGLPFLVTADHGTTRGFAKIAYVIQADLSKLAQSRTGDLIQFQCVSEQEAVLALQREREILKRLKKDLRKK